MRTPGELALVRNILEILSQSGANGAPEHLLNIGAGQSVTVEDQLLAGGAEFTEDRVDIDNPTLDHPTVRKTWSLSVEDMAPVPSGRYKIAFANYLLEHVPDLDKAAAEIHRVLADGGYFVTTVPNPTAPEFVVSRITPTAVHTWFKGKHTWDTYYAYHSIDDLCRIFERAGFTTVEVFHSPIVGDYTSRYPVLRSLGKAYDKGINAMGIKSAMGDVCVAFRKLPG